MFRHIGVSCCVCFFYGKGQKKGDAPLASLLAQLANFHFVTGWHTSANLIIQAMDKTISEKKVTYDFERQMAGATKVKCSEFGKLLVGNMVLDGDP